MDVNSFTLSVFSIVYNGDNRYAPVEETIEAVEKIVEALYKKETPFSIHEELLPPF